jgi:hypothetical protein
MIKSKSNVIETVENFKGREAVIGLDQPGGFFDERDLSK